uniref:LNR domain-containing protein n=1 Tax=Haemonchus placei TaxID=6290 RepID=A0A158QKV4_HAEPC
LVTASEFHLFFHTLPKLPNQSFISVLVTTSSAFSLRQPMNSMNLIIRDDHHHLIVDSRPKIYRLFSSPIFVEIPTNLSFRAIIVVSVVINCSDSHSFRCSGGYCSSVCVPSSLRCDSIDNCLIDEIACGNETEKLTQLNSSFRYHTILRSSQLMLVGFFVLNGAFIVFFLLLSICSVSGCFSRKLFRKKTRASRMTFVKYLRLASHSTCTPLFQKKHSNGLSFVTFTTSPALREVEPEVEDRSLMAPKEEICSLPSYQPEVSISVVAPRLCSVLPICI